MSVESDSAGVARPWEAVQAPAPPKTRPKACSSGPTGPTNPRARGSWGYAFRRSPLLPLGGADGALDVVDLGIEAGIELLLERCDPSLGGRERLVEALRDVP
jgi:hypothetical protein